MESVLAEIQYFPVVDFFAGMIDMKSIVIEAHENYQKQTFRNRCNILTSNGVQMLVVPVLKTESRLIRDIKIDYSQKWTQIHLRSLQTAYGKAPYFEHYIDLFSKIIMSKHTFLFDLNLEIMSKCLKIFKMDIKIDFTDSFTKEYANGIKDMRGRYISDQYIPSEIDRNDDKAYFQLFGSKFVNSLSVIDLIFNEGTNARQLLYKY